MGGLWDNSSEIILSLKRLNESLSYWSNDMGLFWVGISCLLVATVMMLLQYGFYAFLIIIFIILLLSSRKK